jgi:hypothetical protein
MRPKTEGVCPFCGVLIPISLLRAHRENVHSDEVDIYLESKRGTRVDGWRECDQCHRLRQGLWRYPKSNRGKVYICGRCKEEVRDRSFHRVDVMNTPLVWVNPFETNRRKH